MHDEDGAPLSMDGRLTGDEFRRASFDAVRNIGTILGSTYGPHGQDKLMVASSGTGFVTNQGSEILDRLEVRNPVTRLLVDAWNFADQYADGTTFATLFAAALAEEAERLIEEGVSPIMVAQGYGQAADIAVESLADAAVDLELTEKERYALVSTATTGRLSDAQIKHLRQVVLDTAMVLSPDVSLDRVEFEQSIRLGIDSTRVVRGAVLRSDPLREDMPYEIDDAHVLLLTDSITPPDPEDVKMVDEITISGPGGVEGAINSREERFETQLDAIRGSGADVVVCSGSLDPRVVTELTNNGILAFDGLLDEEFERVHDAVGGRGTHPTDIPDAELGYAERVLVTNMGSGSIKGVLFADCPDTEIASVMINAGTAAGGSLTKRILQQGIGTLAAAYDDPRAIPGGGAAELIAAETVDEAVTGVSDTAQLAIEAYADALTEPVSQLIRNAGYSPLDTLPELSSAHADGEYTAAFDIDSGDVVSAYNVGIIEPLRTKQLAISAATEFVTGLLRTDAALPASDDEDEETDAIANAPSSGGGWGMPE